MFFTNSTINQCHLVESKMLTWTTASKSYLSWIYSLSKNLPCSAGSWSIKYMSVTLHFSPPHLPETCRTNTWSPKHTSSISRNSPLELLNVQPTALHLHETWAKNQQKCSVQRKKNPALIYSDCSSSLGTNNAWGCLTVVPSHFIKNTPISTVGFCISLFQPLCKCTEII